MEAAVKPAADRSNVALALMLVLLGVLLRVLPHPANFAPMAAIAIFAGAILPRYWGVWITLTSMMLSDIFIGLHHLIVVTWGCYILIALASHYYLQKRSIGRGTLMALSGSVFFFLVTNFAVWLEGRLYPRTLAGLGKSYTLALPFFRNTLLSDLCYTGLFFGLYWLGEHSVGLIQAKSDSGK